METPKSEFFHEFECNKCEGHWFVEAKDIHNLHREDWRPKFCPYCGCKGPLFLDWKHEKLPLKSIDVQTCGDVYHTEDIETYCYAVVLEDGNIRVQTPKGLMIATPCGDTYFPGVSVSIDGHEYAVIEYNHVKGKHQVVVWGDHDADEPTHIIELKEEILNEQCGCENEQRTE